MAMGTADILAAPLIRGRHSRREDGRLDRLSRLGCCTASRSGDRRAVRMAANNCCACSSLKQHALFEHNS